jgi:hypothetical protein
MSQRPYRIHDDTVDAEPMFNIAMDWDAIEPYIANEGNFGITSFTSGCGISVMIINTKEIRKCLDEKNEHALKHENLLRKISESTKRDLAFFEIS